MLWSRGKSLVIETLERGGVRLNGDRPFDLVVKDDSFYPMVFFDGLSGARDAYVLGYWDTAQLDEMTTRLFRGGLVLPWANRGMLMVREVMNRLYNIQQGARGLAIQRHYDLGNDLFEAMLDPLLNYSCGYWRDAKTLAEAQEAKLDLICRKLQLQKGMRVLDIGCGWGGFARFAAERYGVSVVGISISERQIELGRERCKGLPVELRLQDYRALDGERFDAVVSIGMFEHVGFKNHRRYMEVVRRSLREDGLFLLHTIGSRETITQLDPWTEKNIFPNTLIPSAHQITEAFEPHFILEDWHNFGADYDKTLMAWFENFERAWPSLRKNYDDRFYRIWKCYLLTSAGAFRSREHQLFQVVLSPRGVMGGYRSIR
jgi:cyclopropane-fatty-acyl-phospholipid synthase